MSAPSEPNAQSPVRRPAETIGPTLGRGAALGLALGGLAVLWGSFDSWRECSSEPCGGDLGFMHLFVSSGIDLGVGVPTAGLGLLLALMGLYVLRSRGKSPFRGLPLILASLVLAIVATFTVATFVVLPEAAVLGPGVGLFIVAAGAAISMIAGARLRHLQTHGASSSHD